VLPPALRSPIALITIGVLVVAAIGLVLVLVQNVVGGSPATALAAPPQPVPAGLAHDRSIGKPNAPVKLDEWEDFQCPYCDAYTTNVEPHLISQYVTAGQLAITYHDFSFIGSESLNAAVAARCAGSQGQFWAYMEYLFANQGPENGGTFNQALFDKIATRLNLDLSTFNRCLTDPAVASAVQAETKQGQQLGIQGTPTLFINGKQYTGPLDLPNISAAIDAALRSAPSPAAAPGASAAPGAASGAPSVAPSVAPAAS
jgi:protein-disulfide isomerase